MNQIYKKIFALALLIIAPITTEAIPSMYKGWLDRIKNPTRSYADVQRSAKLYENKIASELRSASSKDESYLTIPVETGTINVGTDNAGQPIFLGYLSAGNKTHNKGTIVCVDRYLGKEGFEQHAKRWSKKGYYVIAFDSVAGGASSTNDPVALDGVGGFKGYSYPQIAYFYNQAFIAHGINKTTDEHPLTFIGTDQDCTPVMVYSIQYKDNPYAMSYLICETVNFSAIVSNDPCSLGLLSLDVAQEIAAVYPLDPCGTFCALYSGNVNQAGNPGNFTEVNCPEFGDYLLNYAVSLDAKLPANIFTRLFTESAQYDISTQLADIPVPTLIIYGGIYQLLVNKQICNMGLYGMCYACQKNAQGTCTDTTYRLPIPNSIALHYQDACDVTHATRFKRFNKDVIGFISGKAGVCDPINKIGEPKFCQPCPNTK